MKEAPPLDSKATLKDNQTIDKFREKIPVERKHESHPLYFAPIISNLNHPFSLQIPSPLSLCLSAKPHQFCKNPTATRIHLTKSLYFLSLKSIFSILSHPFTGSPSRDIFSPTCLAFLLACYFKVQKAMLLFKLTDMTKEHLIANINIQELSNLSKNPNFQSHRDNCKEEHLQIANTKQIQPE